MKTPNITAHFCIAFSRFAIAILVMLTISINIVAQEDASKRVDSAPVSDVLASQPAGDQSESPIVEPNEPPVDVSPIESNSELIEAVNSMERVLSGESAPQMDGLRDRLIVVGLFAGTFLCLLAVLFCYLRLDHASRGFYSGRLQMGAMVASVAILALCYLLWSQVLFG